MPKTRAHRYCDHLSVRGLSLSPRRVFSHMLSDLRGVLRFVISISILESIIYFTFPPHWVYLTFSLLLNYLLIGNITLVQIALHFFSRRKSLNIFLI